MGIREVTDRNAVLDAIDEFEVVGRDAFLSKYGFGPARTYVIEYTGKRYDSKAILGAAHGYQHGSPLGSHEFSGGDATVKPVLEALGFRVIQLTPPPAASPGGSPSTTTEWSLAPGDVTTRSAISAAYGGSIYGGIEPSTRTPNVVIYTDPAQGALNGYNYDGWDSREEGVFYYTGEGRKGDQRMAVGNKALMDHAETGKTIRLFEAIGTGKQRGGKQQRYVGAFRIDPSQPWRFEDAPDADGVQRKVIVFRLLSEEGSAHGKSVIPPPPLAGGATFVASEQNTVTEYETTPAVGTTARRMEAELVKRFEDHLEAQGHSVGRVRIPIPDEKTTLVTDPYDATNGTLYEAKSSSDRATVRLAVGQLLDYLRFTPDAKGSLLLPSRPSPDLVAFIGACGFGLVYPDGELWQEVAAARASGPRSEP